MEKEPYLSIVIAVRNDNYGGDFNQRLYTALSWNTGLLEKYQVNTEIILVNWNPIIESPALLSQFTMPENRQHVRYRVIEVPHEFHLKYCDEKVRKRLPMYEFIAKNVGIERAHGQFVLCTNADILLSEQVVKQIAKKKLLLNVLYRCVRVDVKGGVEDCQKESEIRKRSTKFFLRTGAISTDLKIPFGLKKFWCYSKDFILRILYTIWITLTVRSNYEKERIFIFKHPLNASGDFALIGKSSFQLKALYPENTYIATHTDSLHVLKCLEKKLKIQELNGFVFHQEHTRRFDFEEVNEDMDNMFYLLLKAIYKLRSNKPLQLDVENKLAGKPLIEYFL